MNQAAFRQYAEYLAYLARNDSARVPMTTEEFVAQFNPQDQAPATGKADPMHY